MKELLIKWLLSDAGFGAGVGTFILSFGISLNGMDNIPAMVMTLYSMCFCMLWLTAHVND